MMGRCSFKTECGDSENPTNQEMQYSCSLARFPGRCTFWWEMGSK